MRKGWWSIALPLLLSAAPALAQDSSSMSGMPGMEMPKQNPPTPKRSTDMNAMPGMDTMPGMSSPMASSGILGAYPMSRDASGTSWQPDLAEHHGLHAMSGDWMFMGHLRLFGVYDTQSGPRGDDKWFLAGMLMGAARRDFASGDTLNLRLMLSPDPFMGKRGYPLLLAIGETADGVAPLIDRQHPHDLFMEMAASYSHRLSQSASVFLYAGYPGEPALGPPAFMHRASGEDNPEAPITHHWLDSTHITFGVLTGGVVVDDWKLEVSQFTGREPDQNRFDFDRAKFDSTSARISWNPDPHWSLQASWGFLKSPEQLAPSLNETRWTASASYVTKFDDGASLAATLGWGLKHLSDGTNLNGVLLEGEYKPSDPWTVFARGEWEENDELVPGGLVKRVSKLSLGAIHDWRVAEHWKFGVGASYDFAFVPQTLHTAYSSDPHGVLFFVRLMAE
jgi:hypothetical protein